MAFPISDHYKRAETEVPAALHHFGTAVNIDNTFVKT
jgi:hypothetical protein